MEDLQKALQEQGGKTEDVSAYLLPVWLSLLLPSNPLLSPLCCLTPRAVHCKYHGPRVAPLPSPEGGFGNSGPPLTWCLLSPPVHAAEEEARGTFVSPRGRALLGEVLGQMLGDREVLMESHL